uniref:ER membrane protein complex subunit 4 n=1 Tax=Panagrolaimus sp. PS1159 TaxID=55785 RepID=A0AC35FGT7_9BILA
MTTSSSNNLMNKWRLDFTTGGSRIASRNVEQGLNPPGYQSNFSTTSSEVESSSKTDRQHLLSKRAWDMALQPLKSLPMNMFMMYMAVFWEEHSGSLIVHKIIYTLGNFGAIALGTYKCHSMGLLPTHASDWLDFAAPPERMQYALIGDQFI